jgi:2-succinyl-6-hydroxy-2,4-cyclohexadiene-1-carboxylate synthase
MSQPRTVHDHGQGETWIMLHGFTQTGACLAELATAMAVHALAPDLPGHGPEPGDGITMEAAISETAALLRTQDGPSPLLGYSQGGRVALHVALEHPDLVSRLVVLSASPGIADTQARAQRIEVDEARAKKLETEGLETFLDHWAALPLFAGLAERDEAWHLQDRTSRLTSTAAGLAAALRGLGQGQQEDLIPRLSTLTAPTLFIAGIHDAPYCHHAHAMAEITPQAMPVFLPGKGHALVGEAPQEVARVIRQADRLFDSG